MEQAEILRRIGQRTWFHSIEVAPGVVTPGRVPIEYLRLMLERVAFPPRLDGLSVLDVGAWDGFFSFEAERRGARRVVAYDLHPADYYGFQIARELRDSRVEYLRGSVYDLFPESVGVFDVVLFFGVFYHLRYPLLALDRLRPLTGQYMLFESHHLDNRVILEDGQAAPLMSIDPKLSRTALFQFYRENQLGGDYSNWFAPNRRAIEDSLWSAGFQPEFLSAWDDRVAYRARTRPGAPEFELDSYEGLRVERTPDGKLRSVIPTRKDVAPRATSSGLSRASRIDPGGVPYQNRCMPSEPDDPAVTLASSDVGRGERSSDSPAEELWPSPDAFVDVSGRPQISDGRARCTRLAVCDDEGRAMCRFFQKERMHVFCEFEVLQEINDPFGAIELTKQDGILVHGKTSYQTTADLPPPLRAGDRITFHWTIGLDLGLGDFTVAVHLAETDAASFRDYRDGPLPYLEFSRSVRKHCRVESAAAFSVTWGPLGKLSHHGLTDLPGSASFRVTRQPPGQAALPVPVEEPGLSLWPTVFHVTHWKAGSQWIYKILRSCCAERLVTPDLDVQRRPVERGRVYPTVYKSRQDLESLSPPQDATRFIVIRDLRDTLVSAYFSFKLSHPVIPGFSVSLRNILQNFSEENGLIYLMDYFLQRCAAIQISWLEAEGDLILKYEDLLSNDVQLLESALLDHCRLPITRERLREAILAARFEVLTGGRTRGHEDPTAHERIGIAGDWRNHFTEKVKKAFKARYGGLLVASGYEEDLTW